MSRLLGLVCVGSFVATPALANPHERPYVFKVGLNTRQFANDGDQGTAFRTSTGETDPALSGSSAVSTSLRFTGKAPHDTFLGAELEAGALIGLPGSNLAAAYAVGGMRHSIGRARLSAELVAGRRWVRYEFGATRVDPSVWMAEPRLRADLWMNPQFTIGAAVGATLDDRAIWMAGLYVGFHSHPFAREPLE